MKPLTSLSDSELVADLQDLLIQETEVLVKQLEYLGELDRRKLFFSYPSLWAYLVQELGLEESTAERKIRAARLMAKYPAIQGGLESGKLNLSLLEIASSTASREKLSDREFLGILDEISGLSCRRAWREMAARFPESVEVPRDRIRSISGDWSEVKFVAPEALLEK